MINLHGAGQNGAQQAGITGYNGVAGGYGFVVAYPDGIDASWADGRGASVPDRQGVDDVGFLSALIGKLSADYGVRPARLRHRNVDRRVHGHQAGLRPGRPGLGDRAGGRDAGVRGAVPPAQPVSVMQIHGTGDPVVPFGGGPMVGRGAAAADILSALNWPICGGPSTARAH